MMVHKIVTIVLGLLMCILLVGCVTSLDEALPYPQLPEIVVNTKVSLVASPSHPTSYLTSNPILAGEQVHVIGTDEDAQWLLVLHDNLLGWMPTFFSKTPVGRLKPALKVEPVSSRCTKYLGSTVEPDEEWTSNTSGPAIVLGSIYRAQPGKLFEDATLAMEIDGYETAAAADYVHTPLTSSNAVILFAFSIDDLQKGSQVSFDLTNLDDEPVSFQAAFFSNDCPDSLATSGTEPTERLPIGKTKVVVAGRVSEPKGDAPLPTQPSPTPTPMTIVVESGVCSGTYPTRLQVGGKSSVAIDSRLNVRSRPTTRQENVVGQVQPDETVTILNGPECAENMVWWYIKSDGGVVGWASEGIAGEYFLQSRLGNVTTTTSSPGHPQSASCTSKPEGIFRDIWSRHQTRLGCPEHVVPVSGFWAEQPFQNGHMFWSKNVEIYLVTIGNSSGWWRIFPEDDSIWKEGMPPKSCNVDAPGGLSQPVRGFGGLWCQHNDIREQIGWGVDVERGFQNGVDLYQEFEGGIAFRDSDGMTNRMAYVLFYNDGSFVREKY